MGGCKRGGKEEEKGIGAGSRTGKNEQKKRQNEVREM